MQNLKKNLESLYAMVISYVKITKVHCISISPLFWELKFFAFYFLNVKKVKLYAF